MIELRYIFDLQLFGDGGDGGASADGGSGSEGAMVDADGGTDILPKNASSRAREIQKKMLERRAQKVDTAAKSMEASKNTANPTQENTAQATEGDAAPVPEAPKKLSYKELIESDDYKAEHERYMQRTMRDRMKTHNADMTQANELLSLMGQKYGLDVNSPTFRKDLSDALNRDDSVYEKYAEEHDVPLSEAKKMVGLQQQLERAQKEATERREQEERDKIINALRDKAKETRAQYPDFDIDNAMQDQRFMRMVAALGGDTTAAYEAVNHKVLLERAAKSAADTARTQVANTVRSNLSRPLDSNISPSTSTAPSMPNFREMNKQQLDAWAAQQMRLRRR